MITFKLIEYNSEDWKKSVELRERILLKPFGEVFEDKELQEEAEHIHVIGTVKNEIVAAAVLIPLGEKMTMQRVAISEKFRKRGYGTQLVNFCKEVTLEHGCSTIVGYARKDVIQFYEKHGWVLEEEILHAYGIPHQKMSKDIRNSNEIIFKIIKHNTEDWKKAVKLREDILRKPQGAQFLPWELEEEAKHIHVVGVIADEIVATAVLVPQGENMKMQRVATAENLRDKGYGSQMMDFCERVALDNNCSLLYCHARDTAVKFYLNNGWLSEGDYFDEDGIPHLKMSKVIGR